MQPFDYVNTTVGLIWVIACIPIGALLAVFGVFLLNHIPASWLCDYGETPGEELLGKKRFGYIGTGIPAAVITAVCLVLCRLQFNKGYDIYFILFSLIIFIAVLIAIADLKYQIIPDQFTALLGVLALMISIYDLVRGFNILHGAWWSPLAGAAIGAAVMLLVDFIGMLVYHRDGMGFGDVKLFFAAGILTGFPGTIYAFIISIFVATVAFVIIILVSRLMPSKAAEPETEANTDESGNQDEKPLSAEEPDEAQGEEESVGLGSYLAFGPYIAAAVCAYIALFDLIQYLTGLYLNLFK